MEAEGVLIIELWPTIFLLVMFLLFLIQELLDPQRRDVLQLLLVDALDWVALVLQQMHQVHDLLLPQLVVVDLVIHLGASVVELSVLLHKLSHVFKHLFPALVSAT